MSETDFSEIEAPSVVTGLFDPGRSCPFLKFRRANPLDRVVIRVGKLLVKFARFCLLKYAWVPCIAKLRVGPRVPACISILIAKFTAVNYMQIVGLKSRILMFDSDSAFGGPGCHRPIFLDVRGRPIEPHLNFNLLTCTNLDWIKLQSTGLEVFGLILTRYSYPVVFIGTIEDIVTAFAREVTVPCMHCHINTLSDL